MSRLSRRALLRSGAAIALLRSLGVAAAPPAAGAPAPPPARTPAASTHPIRRRAHVAVIGAGAFGGWTALHLARRGARVTLLDAWGAGNARASSGGETRVIRGTYGPDGIYAAMVARALHLWRDHEKRHRRTLYRRTGCLWMAGPDDAYEQASLPHLRAAGLPFETLTSAEAAKRFPQVNFEGVAWAILEKEAGYLLARHACQSVLEAFLAEGGESRQAGVEPGPIASGALTGLRLSDGSRLAADRYVFACGPWLGRLFPDVIGERVAPTRQEVLFFGTPAGDPRYLDDRLPVWIDNGARPGPPGGPLFYGIPGNERRGFKIADDTRGEPFDPTHDDRVPSRAAIGAARGYLEFRFPGLEDAPLLESRVCQYENSPDGRFIIDRHPGASNVVLIGGGSGHGFKHGPVVGERAADLALGDRLPDPFFALARLAH